MCQVLPRTAISFSSFLYYVVLKAFIVHSPQVHMRELETTSLRMECLHKLSEILLHGRKISSSHLLIYSNHLFIFILTCGYLFYNLSYNQDDFIYFVAQIVLSFATESFFNWSCVPLIHPHAIRLILNTFLLSGMTRCSRLILSISCPHPRISHFSRQSYFLSLENDVRI